jgi:hypothetical protein
MSFFLIALIAAVIGQVVGQAKSPEGAKAIADIGGTAKVSVGEVEGLGAKIKELPFSIRSPEAKEKEQIILLEETINKMYGLGGDKLKAILPLVYHDEYEERNYNQLIKDLDSGEFLPKLKRAFAFFGAMRVGEDFKARISVVINNAIATKDAGLVHGEFADRARMASAIGSNVLQEVAILGKISSDELRLLKRIPVGSARGMASQLTPLGKIASQVWTKELLEKKEITVDQLKALSRATEALDKRRA